MPAPSRPPSLRPVADAADDGPGPDAWVLVLGPGGPVAAPDGAPADALAGLVERGEARPSAGSVAHVHGADGTRWVLVGLATPPSAPDGAEADEALRDAVAVGVRRATDLRARTVRVRVADPRLAAIAAEAALLAAHRHEPVRGTAAEGLPERARARPTAALADPAEEPVAPAATPAAGTAPVAAAGLALEVSAPGLAVDDAGVADAVVRAEAQNAARVLQQVPANRMTPRALALAAQRLGDDVPGLDVHVETGLGALEARGMGLFAGTSYGSDEPPALIVARWTPQDAEALAAAEARPVVGLVGKGVTHDTGGYSLKPGPSMVSMKMDMTGGAVVLQAMAAIARLRLPVRVVAVVGATENLVNGRAMKPGDVLTAANGTTVEITNTDAEGRLVLGDCLTHALALGAERLVDVATLTGGVVTAFGTSHAGLMGRDRAWLDLVRDAGEATGELVWPLPLHDDHRRLMRSASADLQNSGTTKGAHASRGAAFLERFTGDVPWAHVDIAGVKDDLPRRYLGKGPSGFGVRLLVETVRRVATG